ncbi:ABC transporter ATP-binding protein [Cyclobacterium salsum]|uniref:ABC transporter ATP-binding protein n=1 Tax=Cyclobacterium salsum TaxID=2666329 RepID=UPI0013907FD9|nr:ABC transporter ATP-binding protein [Cyclobacterium salsum]
MIHSFINKYFKNFLFFYKRMGNRVFVMVVLTVGVGLMDGMGLTMFLPLFDIAAGTEESAKEVSTNGQNPNSIVETLHIPVTLINILGLMVVFYLIKGAIQFVKMKYETDTGRFFMLKTRKRLIATFSEVQYKYFVTANVGRIQNIMTGELAVIYNAFVQYINMMQQVVMVLVYMSFAIWMNAQFAILISVGGLIFNFLFKEIYRITKESSRLRVTAANSYQGLIIQFVNNFKYLKATGLLHLYGSKVDQNIEDIEKENRKMGYMGAIAGALREPILIIIVCAVILLQINVLGGSLATILVSLLFFYRALTAVTFLQLSYNRFNAMIGSLENVEWFEQELSKYKELPTGNIEMGFLSEGLELRNVQFSYGKEIILKNIDLTIPAFKTVAFVGESGSGKTTLVNVISGLLPIDSGKFSIDGVPFKEIKLKSFQTIIGYISQDPTIFNDTIYNNVTLWSAKSQENINRFEYAIQKAQILNYVNELPDKGETLLGNNGINVSGGQKQRISIARELFKKVQILIFDEATSALDSETEKEIQSNIDALKGQITIIMIAHRLSTIKNVDEIVLMNKGEIIDKAPFEILKKRASGFKRMVELQEIG